MARSHHRKKHKGRLKMFKRSQEISSDSPKGKTSAIWVFTIGGAILGFAVSYFASNGVLLWMAAGLIAGTLLGYYMGKSFEKKYPR